VFNVNLISSRRLLILRFGLPLNAAHASGAFLGFSLEFMQESGS
jgi:hypothetical protein